MVLKNAIRANMVAVSKNVGSSYIKQKTPIRPTPEEIIKSNAITLSATCGPFKNLIVIMKIARQIIGTTTYNK